MNLCFLKKMFGLTNSDFNMFNVLAVLDSGKVVCIYEETTGDNKAKFLFEYFFRPSMHISEALVQFLQGFILEFVRVFVRPDPLMNAFVSNSPKDGFLFTDR